MEDKKQIAERDDRLYQSLLLKAECTGSGNVAKAFRRATATPSTTQTLSSTQIIH